jgi:hypothetical protein
MCKWTRVCIRPARLRPGVWRSLKSSVGPAVLKKPCIVVYLICQKSALRLLNTGRAAFLCNYNTKPVRSTFQYSDWKSQMNIYFSPQKISRSTLFRHLLVSTRAPGYNNLKTYYNVLVYSCTKLSTTAVPLYSCSTRVDRKVAVLEY